MSSHEHKRNKKHRLSHRPRSAVRAERFLQEAICSMQDNHGNTCRSISNMISVEYGWPKKEVEKRVHVALKKAVASGRVELADGRYKLCNLRRHLKRFSKRHSDRKRILENIMQMDVDDII